MILMGILAIILVLYLLSVFGPQSAPSGFWYGIQKIRSGMDRFSYWFMNFCAIAVILFLAYAVLRYIFFRSY